MALEEVFSFRPDWHQDHRANPLVRQYRTELASVLDAQPRLRRCLKQCTHCGIEFLTDPRNVGRTNLRCPFGCRSHHHRRSSRERSTAYYRTASGRRKKKRLNGRRSSCSPTPTPADGATADSPAPAIPTAPSAAPVEDSDYELRLEGVVLRASSLSKSPLLPYTRLLARLIDGIELGPREFLELLRDAVRQRSFATRNRRDYVLAFLQQHPP